MRQQNLVRHFGMLEEYLDVVLIDIRVV